MNTRVLSLGLLVAAMLLLAPSGSGAQQRWGVHLASYRSPVRAVAGWQQVLQKNHDLLAAVASNYIPVDIPGKGLFTRVIAGAFADRSQALELARELRSRGGYADVLPLVVKEPVKAAQTPRTGPLEPVSPVPPQVVAQALHEVEAVKTMAPPAVPEVAAPAAQAPAIVAEAARIAPPAAPTPDYQGSANEQSQGLSAGDGVASAPAEVMARRVKVLAKGMNKLRKYVAAPEPNAVGARDEAALSRPVAQDQSAEEAREKPDNAPRAGFKDDENVAEDGLTLARPKRNLGRIAAHYGDMNEDYKDRGELAPSTTDAYRSEMKPYVGLGIHF